MCHVAPLAPATKFAASRWCHARPTGARSAKLRPLSPTTLAKHWANIPIAPQRRPFADLQHLAVRRSGASAVVGRGGALWSADGRGPGGRRRGCRRRRGRRRGGGQLFRRPRPQGAAAAGTVAFASVAQWYGAVRALRVRTRTPVRCLERIPAAGKGAIAFWTASCCTAAAAQPASQLGGYRHHLLAIHSNPPHSPAARRRSRPAWALRAWPSPWVSKRWETR